MSFIDLYLDGAPELAQIETLETAAVVLLAVLEHQYPLLHDDCSQHETRSVPAARDLARRARALLAAIRRYRTAVDDRRQNDFPF